MGRLLAKLITLIGGKKVIKKVVIDLLVKVLTRDLISPKKLAREIHDGVQEKGRDLLGLSGYEKLEKDGLEPLAAELLKLWKQD